MTRGETASPHADRDPNGAPYVPGQLLVSYEPGTSGKAERSVVRRAGGRTVENVAAEIRLASFSSHGSKSDLWVDLTAPGTSILSTRLGGGYYEMSGTSQAAPFVSGLAGLLASEGKTASGIRQRMQNTATDLGAAGKDPSYGYGRINANAAVP